MSVEDVVSIYLSISLIIPILRIDVNNSPTILFNDENTASTCHLWRICTFSPMLLGLIETPFPFALLHKVPLTCQLSSWFYNWLSPYACSFVDRGPWYKWAFETLGLNYYHETFGKRNSIERFFATLKKWTKVFSNNINVRKLRIKALNSWNFL